MNIILNKIRNARQFRGYSHEYIAHHLNISQAAYSKIENGKTQLTIQRLFQITEILDISIIFLLIEKTEYYQKFSLKKRENILISKSEELNFLKEITSK